MLCLSSSSKQKTAHQAHSLQHQSLWSVYQPLPGKWMNWETNPSPAAGTGEDRKQNLFPRQAEWWDTANVLREFLKKELVWELGIQQVLASKRSFLQCWGSCWWSGGSVGAQWAVRTAEFESPMQLARFFFVQHDSSGWKPPVDIQFQVYSGKTHVPLFFCQHLLFSHWHLLSSWHLSLWCIYRWKWASICSRLSFVSRSKSSFTCTLHLSKIMGSIVVNAAQCPLCSLGITCMLLMK